MTYHQTSFLPARYHTALEIRWTKGVIKIDIRIISSGGRPRGYINIIAPIIKSS